MENRLTMLIVSMFLFIGGALAQTKVNGTVVSQEDNQPVVGATVRVVDTNVGSVTDINGQFSLTLPAGKKIISISYVGMSPVEVVAKPNMRIVLSNNTSNIDEIVVTGYSTQRKASFTGAASLLSGDVIEKKTDANFVKTLEGSVSGVQMNNSTSMPGVWGSIYVRGRGSLNQGTQPLYVIDGVPVNSDVDGMSSTANNYVDPMSAINPNDIESVTVLKDAAATAIYGSRASNGVIVITTKKGSQGKGNIEFEGKWGVTTMANNNMKFASAEQSMDLFAKGMVARYQDDTYEAYYDYLKDQYFEWDGVTNTDWMDAVTRNGFHQEYNVNASGQTGATNYYISGGYLDTEGIVIGSDFKRYTGRVNLNSKLNDYFSAGVNASYSYAIRNGFSQSTSGSMAAPTVGAVSSMRPFWPVYNEDGTYANVDMYNPVAVLDEDLGDLYEVKTTTFTASPYVKVDFGKGVYFKSTLGINIYNLNEYNYWSAIYNNQGMNYNGLGQEYDSRTSTLTWNNLLGWNYVFDQKHNLGVMLGQEMQRKDYWYDYLCGNDFPFAAAGMRDLSTVGTWSDSEYYKSEARLASYFGDVHYSYEDRYYASASFRRDGSSVFGADNRWGNFWSLGGKWRFTGEQFLKNDILTNGTLRLSYGTVGNQDIGWYSARGFYESGYNYHSTPGMIPGSITNRDLTWEVSKKFDIGVDLQFLNRFNLSFDFYNEKTTDALFQVPLSRTTGMSETYQNIGSIRNRGIELAINANIMNTKDLTWTAYFNMTHNQNEVIKLSTDKPIEGTWNIVEVGHPYGEFYMKEYAGVERETGKPLFWKDTKDENGKVTASEKTTNYNEATKRYVGNPNPKFYGGFGSQLKWKGLDASISFNYRLGGKVYDSGARFTGWGMAMRTPLEEMALNSWTEDNMDAKYPQYIYNDPNNATQASSRFVMSGNFLRLSNITIGYTLPKEITRLAFIEKVRIYGTADNIHTWTASDFYGYNPETFASGVIAWQYPAVSTYAAGIQITF